MPFDATTAASAGRKGAKSRWQDKPPASPRQKALHIRVTDAEHAEIITKARTSGRKLADLIVDAVKHYSPKEV